jgi:hypothetical protein
MGLFLYYFQSYRCGLLTGSKVFLLPLSPLRGAKTYSIITNDLGNHRSVTTWLRCVCHNPIIRSALVTLSDHVIDLGWRLTDFNLSCINYKTLERFPLTNRLEDVKNELITTCIHTYHPRFILEGVAESSQIFPQDAQVLPKLFSYK